MSEPFTYLEEISLHIKDRISNTDALRQQCTAKEILNRLKTQPGLILADEVGMGKTYVALAVAVSAHLSDPARRPAVVMVPSSLREKWPREFDTFVAGCLPKEYHHSLRCRSAERSEDFLKLIDDKEDRRAAVIFLTHGAMVRGLTDSWIKLALIFQALRGRRNADQIRGALFRFAGKLLQLGWIESYDPDIWEALLTRNPSEWSKILRKRKIDPSGQDSPETADTPVPQSLIDILPDLDTNEVFEALQRMPIRSSDYLDDHLRDLRRTLTSLMKQLWQVSIGKMKVKLPLLILDEAHHLKNADTQTAGLFRNVDSAGDANEISKGALAGVFSRMLFLTATPFQLGHHELISVLDRFSGIDWNDSSQFQFSKEKYLQALDELRKALDASQSAALRLDRIWGQLQMSDLQIGDTKFSTVESWWEKAQKSPNLLSGNGVQVVEAYDETQRRMLGAQGLLQRWVIRHTKSRTLPESFKSIQRRETHEGGAILNNSVAMTGGLRIEGDALLPFLLAARAVACSPETRPVFAEGLASSYEAFLHTRKKKESERAMDDDEDDHSENVAEPDTALGWYLTRIEEALPSLDGVVATRHPKIAATVDRALSLWERGEKVLIFCHYVATGRTLRQMISDEITSRIEKRASERTGLHASKAMDELEKIGKRLYAEPLKTDCEDAIGKILSEFSELNSYQSELLDVVRRMLRTPSFLIRFFPLEKYKFINRDLIDESFKAKDASGLTFETILREFFTFLSKRCENGERKKYIEAVNRVQTGSHIGVDIEQSLANDERQDPKERLVANVRLANGGVRQETRQRLMLTFNTPFYPEILIASSVMAEGVDLHLNCRHVIHHDLSWNPSSLEQRTGRVDRIGAKVERCGKPIQIYLPYVAETQDEKMFRVVMDRERWFKVVMGEKYKIDARTSEALAARLPFPMSAAEQLAFKLSVFEAESMV